MKFAYEDHGFCRVVYHREVEGESGRKHRVVYCWQLGRGTDFEFYRCSQDGEPSHEVAGWGGVPAADMTPDCPGNTETGRALNAFLKTKRARQ